MRNPKIILLCLSVLCCTGMNRAALGQEKKPAPPTKTAPPAAPVAPPTNPLLAPPNPKAPRAFLYTVIPFETLEPTVQLTTEQSAKIKPAYARFDSEASALRLAARTPEEKRAAGTRISELQNEADRQIESVLTDPQKEKAKPLMFEMVSMLSIGLSKDMLRDMKLTPDQRKSILKRVEAVQAQYKALPATERSKKYLEIMLSERVKIPALLTDAQKAVFERYTERGLPKTAETLTPVPVKTDKPVSPNPFSSPAADPGKK